MRTASCIAAALGAGGVGTQHALAFSVTPGAPAHSVGTTGAGNSGSCSFCSVTTSPEVHASTFAKSRVITRGALGVSYPQTPARGSRGTLSMAQGEMAEASTVSFLNGEQTPFEALPDEISTENPLRVVIAGGGVGGLLAAKYMKMQGFDVRRCSKKWIKIQYTYNSIPYGRQRLSLYVCSVSTMGKRLLMLRDEGYGDHVLLFRGYTGGAGISVLMSCK